MELREHAKISLAELAVAIGVTKATIWQYEHGQRRISPLRLEEIARALYCEQLAHATRIAAAETKYSPAAANDSDGLKSPALSADCRRRTHFFRLTKRVFALIALAERHITKAFKFLRR
jgi:transcriptional regulator with XRE-family HTH domain